jgi:hypothetical protein
MIVSSTLTPKGNPGNPEALRKFYARAKSNGELTLRKLSNKIAEGFTTESDTDVLAELNDRCHLLNGDFGSFQVDIAYIKSYRHPCGDKKAEQ